MAVLAIAALAGSNASAYEVWLGLHCTPASAAANCQAWSKTASLVSGLNCNLAPCKPSPGTPCANETACGPAEWKSAIVRFKAKDSAITEIPRSEFGPYGRHADSTLEVVLESKFKTAAKYGYTLSSLMFYDNKTGGDDHSYSWSVEEVQQMRKYLDSTGRKNVGLMYDARNNGAAVRKWCANPLVTAVLLEANSTGWLSDKGGRQDLLKWLWTSKETVKKRIIFQITPAPDPYGATTNYMSTRGLIRWLGTDLMGWNFMRSPRVVFMPVTYNNPTIAFYPETNANGSQYANTMTGLVLSLIEQRDLFEGRIRIPSKAEADSNIRQLNQPKPLVPVAKSIPAVSGSTRELQSRLRAY